VSPTRWEMVQEKGEQALPFDSQGETLRKRGEKSAAPSCKGGGVSLEHAPAKAAHKSREHGHVGRSPPSGRIEQEKESH